MDRESEKRTLEFIRKNAKAGQTVFRSVLAKLSQLHEARHAEEKH